MSTPSTHRTPASPTPPQAGAPETPDSPEQNHKPETLEQVLKLWSVMVALELAHQILSVIMALIDPTAMRAAAREQSAAEGLSDAMVNSTVTVATLLVGLLNLGIIAVLAWMIMSVSKKGKKMPTAFLLLTIFTFFFIFRALLLFLASPNNDVPLALYAIDGSIQILLAVAGVIAYLLARQPEVLDWIGPRLPQNRAK